MFKIIINLRRISVFSKDEQGTSAKYPEEAVLHGEHSRSDLSVQRLLTYCFAGQSEQSEQQQHNYKNNSLPTR